MTVWEASGSKASKSSTSFGVPWDRFRGNLIEAVVFENSVDEGQVVAGRHSTISKDIDSPTVLSKTISQDEE